MKIPSKADLIMWGLIGLAVAGLVAVVVKWKHDAGLLKIERVEHRQELKKKDDEIAKAKQDLATERHNAQLARDSSNAYQQQLEDLRSARAATPTRSVRLCVPAADLPGAIGGSASPGEGAVPAETGPNYQVGRDIGTELYTLADEADECAVQRDALIDWIKKTTAQ